MAGEFTNFRQLDGFMQLDGHLDWWAEGNISLVGCWSPCLICFIYIFHRWGSLQWILPDFEKLPNTPLVFDRWPQSFFWRVQGSVPNRAAWQDVDGAESWGDPCQLAIFIWNILENDGEWWLTHGSRSSLGTLFSDKSIIWIIWIIWVMFFWTPKNRQFRTTGDQIVGPKSGWLDFWEVAGCSTNRLRGVLFRSGTAGAPDATFDWLQRWVFSVWLHAWFTTQDELLGGSSYLAG